jgi:four helix bundle protein
MRGARWRGTGALDSWSDTHDMSNRPRVKRDARSFRDLVVWQEANALAKAAIRVAAALPAGYGFLADQLRRAATSIPWNIAEGNGKPTRRDYLKFLGSARGSLNEVEAAAELLRGTDLAPAEQVDALIRHVTRAGRLLAALIESLEPSSRPTRSRGAGPAV